MDAGAGVVIDEESGLKVLMVSEDLPGTQVGGLGKHVVTLSNALLELGHEVDIMGRSDRFQPRSRYP